MLNNKSGNNIPSIVKNLFSKNIRNIRYERKIKLNLNQSDLFYGTLESMGMGEPFKPRNISSIYFPLSYSNSIMDVAIQIHEFS